MGTATLEELVDSFLETRAEAESFPVEELTAFCSANLAGKGDDEQSRKRLNRDIELILEGHSSLFYRAGSGQCFNRGAFFKGARFKIRPSALEIKEGLLFYGARFAPFCSEDVFADEYNLVSPGSELKYQPLACPVQFGQIAKLFQMLGRSTMIDCIVADDAGNYQILQNTTAAEKALVKLTAFNFGAFYQKHHFSEGDAVIATVQNWNTGSFTVEYASQSSLDDQSEISAWISDFEEGLIQAYEDYGEYLEIPDQIAHAYLCAFQQGHDLRKRPFLSLEEYPTLMRDITIRRDGPEWTLVPVDEPTVSGGYDNYIPEDEPEHDHSPECSCGHHHCHPDDSKDGKPLAAEDFSASSGRIDSLDHLLEDLSAPLDYTEIYAMIQDDLANGQESAGEFVRKLIDFMGVHFADDAQEAAFYNFVEECWEDASERFDPVIEETKTPLRTRLLELNSRRLELARTLVERYRDSKIPKKTVDRMKDFHARILNTLGLLNADRSLPEGAEYEQLELRIGDIEDDWDEFEEQQQ
ncbi:MAG: hypothetical protein J5858_12370 [Lentisphaeria bacterium]|nr:hypothetical protein [Lentisphaeria bacterium]